MKNFKCLDYYGMPLKIGDKIIPMFKEALIINIEGIISNIKYIKDVDKSYITISDYQGNILLKDALASDYTTRERFNQKEKENYIYSLIFFDKNFHPITILPLTNRVDTNYKIPNNPNLVTINAYHSLNEDSFSFCYLYYLIVKNKNIIFNDEENNFYYLKNLENDKVYPLNGNYKIFKNKEELQEYIKMIIEYFKMNQSNDKNYGDFEKRLIKKINKS